MDLVVEDEIILVLNHFGYSKPLKWYFEEFQDKVIGYMSDQLKLIIEVENLGVREKLRFFVKCMPRNNEWKSEYLKEFNFFKKEYYMLSSLFKQFLGEEGIQKWRPELLYIREDLFIFEDVGHLGYVMPHPRDTMTYDDLKATIHTLARFHAASYILEEKKSREIGRPYRIWEDYSEYLQGQKGQDWRDTGRNAIINFLRVFSKYKTQSNILKKAELVIPMLFNQAMILMKPRKEYRNVVVHRDLWSNNILIKRQSLESEPHAIIVDFQTVLYSSPMLDLASLIYFNTTRADREEFSNEFLNIYHKCLSGVLQSSGINVNDVFPEDIITKSYNESIVFGITQAALMVPIVTMRSEKREEIFGDADKSKKIHVVSRSDVFIKIAAEDKAYRDRVSELFEEIVDRYVVNTPKENDISKTYIIS